ncbi:MAG: M12 family metallo-peptidase, partial [Bacteroidota bacterium]
MRIVFYIVISALIIGSEVFAGQNQTEINAGSFIQKTSSKNIEYVQNDVQYSSFSVFADDLRNAMLKSATMKITDFPVSLNEKANLLLKRNRNIIDANTKFFTGGYNGDLPLKLPVIESYEGVIENVENSKVFLIITNGYLFCKIENENSNFILAPMNGGNFEQYVLVDEKTFYKNSPAIGTNCIADAIQEPLSRNLNKNTKLLSNDLLECELAIETDTEFFKAAGSDLNKATAYLTALFSFVSRLYEEQVRITFHLNFVKIWTNSPADPYDAKGDWQVLNNKVTAYWKDHYQNVERDLAHILTSISYGGGGFGYFDALCGKKDKGYAVTSLQGANNLLSFAFSYDIYIVAHEIGHNFNAQHTHSCFWGAPLDTCIAADAIQGGCLQAGTAPKPNPGSIMSYCGGTNNTAGLGWQVRLIFLPQNETLIRTTAEAANCITAPLSPMVKLTNPYNTESRQSGDTVLIEWRSARVSNIRLDYSADGGANWDSIADGLPSADEKYIWKTPDLCSRNVLIRISDADNEQVNNVLLKPFSIITPDFL